MYDYAKLHHVKSINEELKTHSELISTKADDAKTMEKFEEINKRIEEEVIPPLATKIEVKEELKKLDDRIANFRKKVASELMEFNEVHHSIDAINSHMEKFADSSEIENRF